MTTEEKMALRQLGVQFQNEIAELDPHIRVSLDKLEGFIQADNIIGAFSELGRIREYSNALIRFKES